MLLNKNITTNQLSKKLDYKILFIIKKNKNQIIFSILKVMRINFNTRLNKLTEVKISNNIIY